MSGFDKDWLALREPADVRARNQALLKAAIEAAESTSATAILDIGCGTGSTFRALSPRLRKPAHFRLFDYDPRLLDEAQRQHGNAVEIIQGDLNQIGALPLADISLVTASALFDLCSEEFIRRFVARLSQTAASLYAALNYDGRMRWSKPHPLDEAVVANFNAHQLGDKGFGFSLGPRAWETLTACLKEGGYATTTAESPWVMTADDRGCSCHSSMAWCAQCTNTLSSTRTRSATGPISGARWSIGTGAYARSAIRISWRSAAGEAASCRISERKLQSNTISVPIL